MEEELDAQVKPTTARSNQSLEKRASLKRVSIKKHKVSKRQLPKDVLSESLLLLRNKDHKYWDYTNTMCSPRITFDASKELTLSKEMSFKLKLVRQCFLQRDWLNLAKILTLNCFNERTVTGVTFPTFAKYGALCLFNTDKNLLHTFLQAVVSSTDFNEILKICSTYPSENDVELYT